MKKGNLTEALEEAITMWIKNPKKKNLNFHQNNLLHDKVGTLHIKQGKNIVLILGIP